MPRKPYLKDIEHQMKIIKYKENTFSQKRMVEFISYNNSKVVTINSKIKKLDYTFYHHYKKITLGCLIKY